MATRRAGSRAHTRRLERKVIPRSAKAATNALEVAGDGGIGAPNGMTKLISHASRTPRVVRYSCSNKAASLGAGGHLNGAEVTPTIARPFEKVGSTSRKRSDRKSTRLNSSHQ